MNRIGWGVVIAHCVVIVSLCVHHFFVGNVRKKIVVRTVHVPQVQTQSSAKVAKAVGAANPQKKEVKKVSKMAPVAKKTACNVDCTFDELAKLLEAPVEKKVAPITLPSLPLETVEESANYGELLMSLLQTSLVLPDFGSVKMEIEIDPLQGKLLRCTVLESQSEKNADFLQKELPTRALPCFNGKSNETFVCTILFKNL